MSYLLPVLAWLAHKFAAHHANILFFEDKQLTSHAALVNKAAFLAIVFPSQFQVTLNIETVNSSLIPRVSYYKSGPFKVIDQLSHDGIG